MNDKIAVELAKEIELLNKQMATQAKTLADLKYIVERLDELFVTREEMEAIAVKINDKFKKITG